MKMQKTDIGVVVFMYAVCGFFYVLTLEALRLEPYIPEVHHSSAVFPHELLSRPDDIECRRFGVESSVDTVFAGFKPVQFIVSVALILVYFFLMKKYVGFFVSTTLFMLACLLFLRVPILATVISIVSIDLLIYLAFVLFLGVRLPAGILF